MVVDLITGCCLAQILRAQSHLNWNVFLNLPCSTCSISINTPGGRWNLPQAWLRIVDTVSLLFTPFCLRGISSLRSWANPGEEDCLGWEWGYEECRCVGYVELRLWAKPWRKEGNDSEEDVQAWAVAVKGIWKSIVEGVWSWHTFWFGMVGAVGQAKNLSGLVSRVFFLISSYNYEKKYLRASNTFFIPLLPRWNDSWFADMYFLCCATRLSQILPPRFSQDDWSPLLFTLSYV